MNRNFIFVFILLATFSMINALPLVERSTTFNRCTPEIDSLTVSLNPDPPVSNQPEGFTVSGTLSKNDITAGTTILGIGYADSNKNPLGIPYTQTFDKSYKAGSAFSISASNVPTPDLPNEYYIAIIVGDPTNDPKNPVNVFACAYAEV